MAIPLFYTNNAGAGDGQWETLTNWNYAADNSGANPTEVPWSGADGSTSANDLVGTGSPVTINSNVGSGTGTCNIGTVTNSATGAISSGTWTCADIENYGLIGGGDLTAVATINDYSGGGTTEIIGGSVTPTSIINQNNNVQPILGLYYGPFGGLYYQGYLGQHYTAGIADTFTGVDQDFNGLVNLLYVSGVASDGGYSGQHYTAAGYVGADSTFTGMAMDYFYSATLFFLNGVVGTAAYAGQHYTLGFPDTGNWVDYDFGSLGFFLFQGGSAVFAFFFTNSTSYSAPIPLPDVSKVATGIAFGSGLVGTLAEKDFSLSALLGLPPGINF